MPQAIFFVQGCPTCGRASQVRMEYLGKPVQCRHCGGEFLAFDEDMDRSEREADGLADREALPDTKPR